MMRMFPRAAVVCAPFGVTLIDWMQYFDVKISKQSKGKRPSHLMRKRQQMAAVLARVDTKVCRRELLCRVQQAAGPPA